MVPAHRTRSTRCRRAAGDVMVPGIGKSVALNSPNVANLRKTLTLDGSI